MKRLALFTALSLAACSPDIPQDPPQNHTIVQFDPAATPPQVPAPNDLAIDPATGKVNAPIDPNSSAANQEFTRDYLNTLNGFPAGTTAAAPVANGDLDPATVNASTVLVIDLTAAQSGGTPQVAAPIVYNPASHQILISPPGGAPAGAGPSSGEWTKGHRYEVVVLGGPNGVKAPGGAQVTGSPAFLFARSSTPLVTCTDLSSPSCASVTGLLSNAQAVQLERLRQGYAPLFNALAAQGIPRQDVAALWTFTITSQPEMTFDPAAGVIPFPSNLVLGPDGGVSIPIPDGGVLPDGGLSTTGQLYTGLNTLDGFSTVAPMFSENSDNLAALTDGAKIDPATLDAGTGFMALTPVQIPPTVVAGIDLVTSAREADGGLAPLPDGGVLPEQLQFLPMQPLQERSQYAAWVTTDLKDTTGQQVAPTTTFALFRSSSPLVDGNGHSTVTGVSDAQAQQIEPIRMALHPMFDALAAQGVPRSKLALAWGVQTQSEQSVLNQLHGVPAQIPGLTADPISLTRADPQLLTCAPSPTGCPYPVTDLGHAYAGELLNPLLLTGPGGTLNPTGPSVRPIPFLLTIPKAAPPASGYPMVIFAHSLTGNRNQGMAIANTLATAGFAMIAIDEVWHGDRSSCTGSGTFNKSIGLAPANAAANVADNYACVSATAQKCDEAFPVGRCIASTGTGNVCTYLSPTNTAGSGGDLYCASIQQGACKPTADGKPGQSTCEGGDFARDATGAVRISGWNMFNLTNLFATRDNFRQPVVDNAQLARTIRSVGLNADLQSDLGATGPVVDSARIQYLGQSLGSLLGTNYVSTAPEVHTAVLNVPAGGLVKILSTSTTLAPLRLTFQAGLAAQGIQAGTPAYDTFLQTAQWIVDPGDPLNSAQGLTNRNLAPADRKSFMQFIQGDQLLPNSTTVDLISAAVQPEGMQRSCASGQAPPCVDSFEFIEGASSYTLPAGPSRDGFLLNGASNATAAAQAQAAQYLVTGNVQPLP